MLPPSNPNTGPTDWRWSPSEKAIARKAYEFALNNELLETIREAKAIAAKISQPTDLWDLEGWLTKRRNAIDNKYDYRYSVLLALLAQLIHEQRLTE